jgi:hypothetical protein
MKKTIFNSCVSHLLLLLLFWMPFSCKKAEDPFDPEMDFKLRLLNDKGEESTVFKEGESFSLSFLITNRLNEKRFFIPDRLVANNGLFRIIKSDDTSDLGQPYKTILCTGWKITVEGKASIELRIPWRSDSTVRNINFCVQNLKKDFIPKGVYKTSLQEFLQVATLEDIRLTKKTDISVNFEIK